MDSSRCGRERVCPSVRPAAVRSRVRDVKPASFERQVEIVLEQMKLCLEVAGSSLTQVVKCNVYCTPDPSHFARFNAVYARYFPKEAPARIFLDVPSWPGPFDVEIDCVAVVDSA
jgi:2-iminobutanoate/2-iminopropanoate deaminase